MGVAAMQVIIAESKFTVEASRDRVWDLLPRVIFNSAGLEKINIINDRCFGAEMPLRLSFVNIHVPLVGEIVDVVELETLAVTIDGTVLWGLIGLKQKITFTFTSKDSNKTEVSYKASAKGSGPIFRWLIVGKAREIGRNILESIEVTLKRLA